MGTTRRTSKLKRLSPVHPGEILLNDFMEPAGLSQNALARAIHVPPRRVNEIILGKRAVTADTALRLSRFFGTTAKVWMNLQASYDLAVAEDRLKETLEAEIMPLAA
jgi:antitoxin HigA-1